jgi:hypothetical protein
MKWIYSQNKISNFQYHSGRVNSLDNNNYLNLLRIDFSLNNCTLGDIDWKFMNEFINFREERYYADYDPKLNFYYDELKAKIEEIEKLIMIIYMHI